MRKGTRACGGKVVQVLLALDWDQCVRELMGKLKETDEEG
jgi:hypothetical protein